MLLEDRLAGSDLLREQIERIVRSEEFRTSEVLRRLLTYLAEKTASGDADSLKEYVIAIEGLGKPSSYDPQHNSAVRIQVGRLRQKLAEYYRNEGKEDPLIIDLPKGRFRLLCEQRPVQPPPLQILELPTPIHPEPLIAKPEPEKHWRLWTLLLGIPVVLALCIGIYYSRTRDTSKVPTVAGWSPELGLLWGPFVSSSRPLIILIEDPLFVELHSNPGVYYRDRSLNSWGDIQSSDTVREVGKALKNPAMQPSRYYTAFGEVDAAFRLGRFLGPHVPLFSLVKASQFTWQQMADNNVIFIGVENLFFEQAKGLPLQLQLQPVLEGVRNLHPTTGEPAVFSDQYTTAPKEQGEIYAVVTHMPGPLGRSDVESFTSNRSAGYVGAVQAFSDPKFTQSLVQKMRAVSGGRMPRYYQVLLKVRFTDDVPVDTTFVLGRELH